MCYSRQRPFYWSNCGRCEYQGLSFPSSTTSTANLLVPYFFNQLLTYEASFFRKMLQNLVATSFWYWDWRSFSTSRSEKYVFQIFAAKSLDVVPGKELMWITLAIGLQTAPWTFSWILLVSWQTFWCLRVFLGLLLLNRARLFGHQTAALLRCKDSAATCCWYGFLFIFYFVFLILAYVGYLEASNGSWATRTCLCCRRTLSEAASCAALL